MIPLAIIVFILIVLVVGVLAIPDPPSSSGSYPLGRYRTPDWTTCLPTNGGLTTYQRYDSSTSAKATLEEDWVTDDIEKEYDHGTS